MVLFQFYIGLISRNSVSAKRFFAFFSAISLSYFSAFRDGLGQDYNNYILVIDVYGRSFNSFEPGYTLLVKLSQLEFLTPLFFFAITSFLINFLVVYSYSRYKSFYASVFVYFFLVILYFNSFNLVRQFLAAALLLYGSQYSARKELKKFLIFYFLAVSFHLSAAFMLLLYWFPRLNINRSISIFVVAISFLVGSLLELSQFISPIFKYFNVYLHYLMVDTEYTSGVVSVFFIFVFLLVCLSVDTRRTLPVHNMIYWTFFSLVVCYNLIPSFFYFHRISVYFLIFFPLVLSLPLRKGAKFIIHPVVISFSFFIFWYFMFKSIGNDVVLPDNILSPLGIFK